MPFKKTVADDIISKVLRNTNFTPASTIYVSIHTASPGETGANENSAYTGDRKSVAFDAPSAGTGVTQNTGAVTFASMPAITVTHIGLWDAATGGNFIWGGALDNSKVVSNGDSFIIAIGDLDIDLTG